MEKPKQLHFGSVDSDGVKKDKIIYELSDKDIDRYKKIGKDKRAIGISLFHCVFLANKYEPNFWNKVRGYRYVENNPEAIMLAEATEQEYMTVEFYEDLK